MKSCKGDASATRTVQDGRGLAAARSAEAMR